jgi:hypothetical protein
MLDPLLIRTKVSDLKNLAQERALAIISQPHSAPVLVLGNQKSGTSAISMLLGYATGLRTQMDFHGAREPYISSVLNGKTSLEHFVKRNAYAFSAPIVKEPGLTFLASQLIDYFPNSPCIFILRNPLQNIRSIFDRLNIPGTITCETLNSAKLPNSTWRAVISGADLGLTGDPVTVQALRWLQAVQEYEANKDHCILIRYEDFILNKETSIEELARKVGLEPRYSIAAIKDKPFQRKGNTTRDPAVFFGSKNYEKIVTICGEAAARCGYEMSAPDHV